MSTTCSFPLRATCLPTWATAGSKSSTCSQVRLSDCKLYFIARLSDCIFYYIVWLAARLYSNCCTSILFGRSTRAFQRQSGNRELPRCSPSGRLQNGEIAPPLLVEESILQRFFLGSLSLVMPPLFTLVIRWTPLEVESQSSKAACQTSGPELLRTGRVVAETRFVFASNSPSIPLYLLIFTILPT